MRSHALWPLNGLYFLLDNVPIKKRSTGAQTIARKPDARAVFARVSLPESLGFIQQARACGASGMLTRRSQVREVLQVVSWTRYERPALFDSDRLIPRSRQWIRK
jgi:hypothetical protein